MNETVNGFRGNYAFLSNFHKSPISVKLHSEAFIFQTAEHVFQAMKVKSLTNQDEEKIVKLLRQLEALDDPNKAKYWGRSININVDHWNSISIKAMSRTLRLKFAQNTDLKGKLISTRDTVLIEYNSWNDTFWGVNEKTNVGENNLGLLLMNLREEFQK